MRNWIAGIAASLMLTGLGDGADAQVYRFNPYSASSSSSAAMYFYGLVGAEYGRDSFSDFGFGLANLTFGFAPTTYGSLPGIGFEFGFFGYAWDNSWSSRDGTGFASAFWTIGGGRLHVGAPRSAVDGINDTPVPGGSLLGQLQLGLYMGLLPYSTWLAMAYDRPFVGLRYDRQAGPLAFAVSAMQLQAPGGTITNLAMAFVRTTAACRVFGTLDYYDDSFGNVTIAAIGGSHRFGGSSSSFWPMVVGGMWSVESNSWSTEHTLSAYATAQVTDRVGVTASMLHRTGIAQTLIGLSLAYEFANQMLVRGGIVHSTSTGSNLWTLGVVRPF